MRKYLLFSLIVFTAIPLLAQADVNPPVDVTAGAKSACAVDLGWGANGNDSSVSYSIEYTTSTDFSVPVKNHSLGSVPDLFYEHAGLKPDIGWTYSYRVRTVGNAVWGPVTQTTTTDLNAPIVPTNIVATGTSAGAQIELAWDGPTLSDYGGFEVWRSENGGAYTKINTSDNLFNGFFVDNVPTPTKSYSYKIKNFESDYGCVLSATPFDSNPAKMIPADKIYSAASSIITVPVMPTELQATFAYSSGNPDTVNLEWTAGSGQSFYQVYRGVNDAAPVYLATISNPATISYSDDKVAPNQKYAYKIRGCTTVNSCSAFSDSNSITVASAPQNPKADVYYTNAAGGSILISWDDTFPGNNYLLEQSADGGATFTAIKTVGSPDDGSRVSYQDKNLPFGKNYSYRVRSDFGLGSFSQYSVVVDANLNMALHLKGTAWATINGSGVGWVNFNSDYGVPPAGSSDPHYSVQIDRNGLISGEAWAAIDGNSDYGWLSFNKSDLTGCPSGTCEAKYSSSTDVVSGWARFLAPKDISNPNWSGWVSLGNNGSSDTISSSSLFGGDLVGAAWGGDIVGWLAFTRPECDGKCTVSVTVLDQPPVVTNVKIDRDPDAWCAETPFYRVTWDYSDVDSDPQYSADVRITKASDDTVITESSLSPTSDHFTRLNDPLTLIGSSTDFAVWIRATDNKGGFSNWVKSDNSTTTPDNYYPFVNFSQTVTGSFATGTVATFTDTTNLRGDTFKSRSWNFTEGDPATASISPVKTIVKKVPLDVSLTEVDSAGNSCIANTTINASGSAAGIKRRIFRER